MATRVSAPATSIDQLRSRSADCTACDLYRRATQTVFGEGAAGASIMLIGEQPGHEEDLAGRPFVGPAGRVLDDALEAAGLERRRVYITNAVKHFKWKKDEGGGKRRIHERPNQGEIEACRPWFEQELRLIRPRVLVCLGLTAATAVLRRRLTIGTTRGKPLVSPVGITTFVTVHPSAILRMPDRASRRAEFLRFVDDLKRASRSAHELGTGTTGRVNRRRST